MKDNFRDPYISDGEVVWWVANALTDAEVKQTESIAGVGGVEINCVMEENFLIPEIQ